MKHIKTRFILVALSVLFPFLSRAQMIAENEADTIVTPKDPLVQVAYKKVSEGDLLGGVSVVNLEKLTEKNYNTYSLDNMQGYIGGWTGNSLWGMGDYLVLVDGVPRDANNVLPTEIQPSDFSERSFGCCSVRKPGCERGCLYFNQEREGTATENRCTCQYRI